MNAAGGNAPADGGGNVNAGGNANVGGNANQAPARQVIRGSSKPPKFEGSFDLYRVEVELYLEERDSWNVVTGDEVRHANDADQQAAFDSRNRLARSTILRGLRGCQDEEANKICGMTTAKEMWDTLVADKTQRDFSYAVLLRRQLYQTTHNQGQSMAEYLSAMTRLRQQLRNIGTEHAIADKEMARVLLMGVSLTHRELVEQFDVPTRQGKPPTLQQVTNALRSRDERDKMVEGVSGDNVNINGGAVVMSMTESKPQHQAQGIRVGSGGVRKKRKCYHCGKPGHIKRECWHFINKSKKVKENQKETKKPDQSNKSKSKKKIVNDGKKPGVINHMMDFSANVSSVAHSYSSSSSSDDEDKDVLMLGMVLRQDSISKSSSWMLDCGSSTHVCVDRNLFSTIKKSKATFKVWTGQITKGIMSGSVMLRVPDTNNDGNVIDVELKDVEFSPAGTVNLISLGKLENEGWIPSFSPVGVTPRKCWLGSNVERLEFVKNGAHYWLDVTGKLSVENLAMTTLNADANPLMLWHERLGHLNVSAIKAMVDRKVADGMDIPAELFKKKFVCMTCMSAKRRRMSYKKGAKEKRTKVNYERLMSDTCDMGKFIPGTGDYRYFQLIQDEGSRYKWCYPIKKKSDSNANTMMLIKKLITQGHRIKTFTSDNGGEFVNNELISFLNVHGIEFVATHPYTPEENALVEKLNGVLVNKTRTAMQAVDMPTALWPEVLQYIVEIDNMSATRALNGRTPFEKLRGKKPDLNKVRV